MPTPQPARLSYRLRLADPLTTDEALAALPDVARRIASDLERRRRRARALALTLTWESGTRRTVRTHLRERLGDPRPLAVELARLFGRCCPNPSTSDSRPRAAPLVALRVTLGDLAVAAPAQATFWDTPARRRATVLTVADALDHRYHRPVLLTARLIAPDAIFTEDRYALVPLAGAPNVAPSPTPPTPPLTEDPWRDVAHRLHWWSEHSPMAHLYRHQILVTLAADGRLTAFRWRDATYHVTKVLSRWHERDRWWLPLASSAVAAPASPPTPPYVPPPKGPTDRHYFSPDL